MKLRKDHYHAIQNIVHSLIPQQPAGAPSPNLEGTLSVLLPFYKPHYTRGQPLSGDPNLPPHGVGLRFLGATRQQPEQPRIRWETSRPSADRPARPHTKRITTFGNGYLGSCDDEERSEMRYVMRIAERESSNL